MTSLNSGTGDRFRRAHRIRSGPKRQLACAIGVGPSDGDPDSPAEIEREPSAVVKAAGQFGGASDADERADDGREHYGAGQRVAYDPKRQEERSH